MLRRARGLLLRFVRRRGAALIVGVALVMAAAWLEFSGHHEAWWIEGLALVMGATGMAILWTGLAGVRPDYIDPDDE